MTEPLIRVDRPADSVALVTLDRPERLNALNPALMGEMPDAFAGLGSDPDVRAVVLTGAGRGFSAGADLNPQSIGTSGGGPPSDYDGARAWMEWCHRGPLALYSLPQPTIAAVHGPAAGGGLGLALSCDIRIAGPAATFRAPFARMGLCPDFGCSALLPAAVGTSLAMELLLTGRRVDATEALRIGLVSQLVDDPLAAALALASQIAALPPDGPPRVKATVRAAAGIPHERVLMEVEASAQAAGLSHPEFHERARRWLAASGPTPNEHKA